MARKASNAAIPTEDELRSLASLTNPDRAALSMYLDTDGRRFPRKGEYEVILGDLLRRAQAVEGLNRRGRTSLEEDMDRVRRYVTVEFDRGETRGLAIYACSAERLWRVYRLPRSPGNQVFVDTHPHVLRLETMIATAERFLTVLINRKRARIFTSRLGETGERTEILDDVPGRHDQGGWSQARYGRHIEELFHRHLRHVGEVLFGFLKLEPFDRLVLAGPEEVVVEFDKSLHAWLSERVAARVVLPMNASRQRVREATLAVEEVLETERVAGTVERIREASASGGGGVVGLSPTLAALHDGRVATFVVADGATRPGRRCGTCGRLSVPADACPACGGPLHEVADLAEEAVDEALRRSSTVLTAIDGVLPDGVGALLRF